MKNTDSTGPQKPAKVRRSGGISWILIALVMIAGGGAGVAIGYGLSLLHTTNTKITQLVEPPFGGRKLIRVLVLGEDNTSQFQRDGRGLSDTIMVAAIDLEHNAVKGVSIPRDTRVEIPGHGTQKINAAHVFGGPLLTKQVVEQLLGVPIDYYVKTDINGLTNIVDAVGGVGIEIEKDMHYTDRRGHLYINLRKGYRHLNGEQALGYVRFRHDRFGDSGYEIIDGKRVATGRIVRQQKFMRALARQMFQVQNLPKMPSLIKEIYDKGYVNTDMSIMDIREMVKITKNILPQDMQMEALPGGPESIDGISYWIADPQETTQVVARMLSGQTVNQNISLNVEVLNGSGISGVAKTAADAISARGYNVVSTGNADNFNYETTKIVCRKGMSSKAMPLATAINCSDVSENSATSTSNTADVTVIVGKDYSRMVDSGKN